MLNIKNLHASINDKPILRGLNLTLKKGEVHAIMGPNGSGKSTLSKILAGHPDYIVTQGSIEYEVNGKMISLLDLAPEERARQGVFLGMQYPVEVPGVNNLEFLRTAFNEVCKAQGADPLSEEAFNNLVFEKAKKVHLNPDLLKRSVNEGFSGGEKKRNEIVQLLVLNPKLALLDETDSGLDIDALKFVAEGVNAYKSKHNVVVLVTHYQRLLDYIVPDYVHILVEGKIVKSGDKTLALELEKKGYDLGL